jgi:hypothetical protein
MPGRNPVFRQLALVTAMIGAVAVTATGTAAAGTGTAYHSPDQAGFAVTGAHFKVAEVRVKLPYASHYAREIGQVGLGVQLWSSATVIDLRVSVCTDNTCKPGGTPVTRNYRPVFRVFSRATGSLICSTGDETCPGTPSAWNSVRFSPGKSVDMSLFYDHSNGFLDAGMEVVGGSTGVDYTGYSPGTGVVFGQARIGAELALTPWSTVSFRRPSGRVKLAKFWEPSTAPFEAELANTGQSSGCIAGWWTRHKLKLTSNGTSSGRLEAQPGSLWNHGCDFNVYLEP